MSVVRPLGVELNRFAVEKRHSVPSGSGMPLRFGALPFDETAAFPDPMLLWAGLRCILVIAAPADAPLTTPPHPRQLGDRRWTKCKSFGQWW